MEREVSLRSGAAVAAALCRLGHSVVEVDPSPGFHLNAGEVDVVFLALHGTYGEDGGVQSELDALGCHYTGSDADGSRLAFDKAETVACLREAGVPVARSVVIGVNDQGWPKGWEPPVVLKPVRQGSSVGLEFVDRLEDWADAIRRASGHGCDVLVEERVSGRELTVGILGEEVLPVIEIRPREGPYDYSNKYTPGATEYLCPAPLPMDVAARVSAAALSAFRAVGARDYGRVDVLLRDDGSFVVLEVNTLPGMTETSLFPKAARAVGVSFDELCERMIEMAWKGRMHHVV